jgi:hypothetical protein
VDGRLTIQAILFFLPKKLEFNYGSSVSRFPDKWAESAEVFFLFGLGSRNVQSRR